MRFFLKNILIIALVLIGGFSATTAFAGGNIDPVQKYSQFLDSNIDLDSNGTKDFINWGPTNGGATVTDTAVTGFIWGETVGWINLHPTQTSNIWVSNACSTGTLGGYGWGENTGWVNFDPTNATGSNHPQINTTTGKITGTVWTESYGWIQLSSPQSPTSTVYDPSLGLVTSWTPSGSCTPGPNGACGSSHQQALSTAPSSGLCSAGTASGVVTTQGGWIWTCAGTNGGSTASCGAAVSTCTGPGCTTGGGQELKVTKYVVNNHGGTAVASDFMIHVENMTTNAIVSHPGGVGVIYSLNPGNYKVSEDATVGYTPVFGGDCDADGNVTLPTDISRSCTITNYDFQSYTDIYACKDSNALNYDPNPDALPKNILCQYSNDQYACKDPDALNYNPDQTLTENNNLCSYPEGEYACKDPAALNYNPDPTLEAKNILCDYPDDQYACKDPDAIDYDPDPTKIANNLLCSYPQEDFCSGIPGVQISPDDCPSLFDGENSTLGTFIENVIGSGFPLKKVLAIIGALGLLGGLPSAISRFGNMLLTFVFGRKKWRGIVYDSNTKEPLDPVSVSVIDVITGAEIATQITDMEGRFGFVLKPGKYKIVVSKTHYAFPSVKLAGRYSDEVYDHLYFGEIFTVVDDTQVVTMNIPMDPTGTDWNQAEKHRKNFFRYFMNGQTKYGWFWSALMVLGFLSSIMVTYFYPLWWNYLMTSLYVVLGLIYAYGKGSVSAGIIKKNGVPLPYAIVRAYNTSLNHEVARKVTSQSGGYYFIIPKGSYFITVEEKNPDGTYTKIFSSSSFRAWKGVINKMFNI